MRYQQLDMDYPLNYCNFTLILVISDFTHRIRYLPTVPHMSVLCLGRLTGRLLEILTLTHIYEKFHLMLLVFLGNYKRSKTKLWLYLYYFHMFWQLFLSLHLKQILVILILIFRIRNLNHVLVKQSHKLRTFHRSLYFFELVSSQTLHLEIALIWTFSHFKLF